MEEERLNESVPDSVIIKYLLKEKDEWLKEKQALLVQRGQDQAYIQELEDTVEAETRKSAEIRTERAEVRKMLAEDERWQMLKAQNAKLRQENKGLREVRDRLLGQINSNK